MTLTFFGRRRVFFEQCDLHLVKHPAKAIFGKGTWKLKDEDFEDHGFLLTIFGALLVRVAGKSIARWSRHHLPCFLIR